MNYHYSHTHTALYEYDWHDILSWGMSEAKHLKTCCASLMLPLLHLFFSPYCTFSNRLILSIPPACSPSLGSAVREAQRNSCLKSFRFNVLNYSQFQCKMCSHSNIWDYIYIGPFRQCDTVYFHFKIYSTNKVPLRFLSQVDFECKTEFVSLIIKLNKYWR